MLQALIAFGQLLWPFLKESVFGNASFKNWLKHNITTAVLFVCVLLMFLAALHLASMLAQERQENVKLNATNTALTVQVKDQTDSLVIARNTVGSLTDELVWTRSYLTHLNAKPALPTPPPEAMPGIAKTLTPRGKPKKGSNDVINALRQWDADHPTPLAPAKRTDKSTLQEIYP